MKVAPVQALVLIDVQTAFLTGEHAVPGADALASSIAALTARARAAGSLVIHLQNDGQPGTPDEPGQPGWALHLPPSAGEPIIRKTHDDGFRDTPLDEMLTRHRVWRIALAGVMSEMCVTATARSALDRGFGVVLPHGAHATCDIPAAPWFGQVVPATTVARVAEWSLGDDVELVPAEADVTFARPEPELSATEPATGQPRKIPFDVASYARRSREGPCFVCAILAGHPAYPHHDVYEDEQTIAFLAHPATLLGYCLVAPKRHIESWVHDFDEAEFGAFQAVVHRVARAIAATLPTERVYSLSLGSQQGNAHLHWHIAPLPPGIPYERQQFPALMAENGVLDVDDAGQRTLASQISRHLGQERR